MSSVFSRELADADFFAINSVLDIKLYIDEYEDLADKLNYLNQKKSDFESFKGNLSEEAVFICENLFKLEIANAKNKEFEVQNKNNKKAKKNSDVESLIMEIFYDYKDYAESHEDLSSYFNFHFLEIRFSTLPYLSKTEQLKFLTGILDDYKAIEKQNPVLSENLFMLASVLYFMPKIAGGSKEEGEQKLILAIENAACNYEKASSMIMYSQILLENKKFEEAKNYFDSAFELAPKNKTLLQLKKANEAGYSMFHLDKYLKTVK